MSLWSLRGAISIACMSIGLASTAFAQSGAQGFIYTGGKADMAYDAQRGIVYISGTDDVRRYDIAHQAYLDPIHVGPLTVGADVGTRTVGLDISPDGSTLAIGLPDRAYSRAMASYVGMVDLNNNQLSMVELHRYDYYEGGTNRVVFDSAGNLLISSAGFGSQVLRRYDPVSGSAGILGWLSEDSHLAASANHEVIGIAETLSNGPWGYYHTGDLGYSSQHGTYNGGTYWDNQAVAVSPDGGQFAIITSAGLLLGDKDQLAFRMGEYGGTIPLGVAYSPVNGHLLIPLSETNYIGEYDAQTLEELHRYEVPGQFGGDSWPFHDGYTKVASDGSYVFSFLDDGIAYVALVPELATLWQTLLGLAVIAGVRHLRARRSHLI